MDAFHPSSHSGTTSWFSAEGLTNTGQKSMLVLYKIFDVTTDGSFIQRWCTIPVPLCSPAIKEILVSRAGPLIMVYHDPTSTRQLEKQASWQKQVHLHCLATLNSNSLFPYEPWPKLFLLSLVFKKDSM